MVKYGLSMLMNIRAQESAVVQPVNEINFYVTPNNVDVVGEYTVENDLPGDYSEEFDNAEGNFTEENYNLGDSAEPVNNLGEDVVPT